MSIYALDQVYTIESKNEFIKLTLSSEFDKFLSSYISGNERIDHKQSNQTSVTYTVSRKQAEKLLSTIPSPPLKKESTQSSQGPRNLYCFLKDLQLVVQYCPNTDCSPMQSPTNGGMENFFNLVANNLKPKPIKRSESIFASSKNASPIQTSITEFKTNNQSFC